MKEQVNAQTKIEVVGLVDYANEELSDEYLELISIFYNNHIAGSPPPTVRELQKIMKYSSTSLLPGRFSKLQSMGILVKGENEKARTWHLNPELVPILKLINPAES